MKAPRELSLEVRVARAFLDRVEREQSADDLEKLQHIIHAINGVPAALDLQARRALGVTIVTRDLQRIRDDDDPRSVAEPWAPVLLAALAGDLGDECFLAVSIDAQLVDLLVGKAGPVRVFAAIRGLAGALDLPTFDPFADRAAWGREVETTRKAIKATEANEARRLLRDQRKRRRAAHRAQRRTRLPR